MLVCTGQLESTILSSYVQAAQLKAWLGRDHCPPAIAECQVLFRKAFAPQATPNTESLVKRPDLLHHVGYLLICVH